MIGYYNYTVWLTFVGMLSSVVGMGFAVQGKIIAAVICLMFSGFCDMFDGIVARTKKDRTDEEKRFGIIMSPRRHVSSIRTKSASIISAFR